MEENKNPLPFEVSGAAPTPPKPAPVLPTGKRELILAAVLAVLSVVLMDFLLCGGFYMAFGAMATLIILVTAGYLLRKGRKLTFYPAALLTLSIVIALSFGRSDDAFVKFVMFLFLVFSANLGLCLLAGQNRRNPAGFLSGADMFRAAFTLGCGKVGPAFRGLYTAGKRQRKSKTPAAVLVGLAIALPLVVILIALLASADAAFEGLLAKLPRIDLWEPFASLLLGLPLGAYLYIRAAALKLSPVEKAAASAGPGLNAVTVNTVLGAVSGVYAVYLLSQLAYFVGGFSGILPEEFTMAQYARRGFFEMAWLCCINLTVIALCVGLTRKNGVSPRSTRILCLFIGVISLFFTVTASAKMFLYIGAYGLTRLRVLTEVIMVFLALTTVYVGIWLFVPKMPYMKAIVLTGLLLGAVTAWADVDSVVAWYNVTAYRSGSLETVDVWYLSGLSDGAVPWIASLVGDADPEIAAAASRCMAANNFTGVSDFRDWNIASAIAQSLRAWFR